MSDPHAPLLHLLFPFELEEETSTLAHFQIAVFLTKSGALSKAKYPILVHEHVHSNEEIEADEKNALRSVEVVQNQDKIATTDMEIVCFTITGDEVKDKEQTMSTGARLPERAVEFLENVYSQSQVVCSCEGTQHSEKLVLCSNLQCPKGWFHTKCVHYTDTPDNKARWCCPKCRSSKEKELSRINEDTKEDYDAKLLEESDMRVALARLILIVHDSMCRKRKPVYSRGKGTATGRGKRRRR